MPGIPKPKGGGKGKPPVGGGKVAPPKIGKPPVKLVPPKGSKLPPPKGRR